MYVLPQPDDPTRPKARLIVRAPAGLELKIVDGQFAPVAGGQELLELDLPIGVYTIRATAAGVTSERVVTLLNAPPLEVVMDPPVIPSAAPDGSGAASILEAGQADAAANAMEERLPATPSSAEIAIFLRSDETDILAKLDSVFLFRCKGRKAEPIVVLPTREIRNEGEAWCVYRFSCRPGVFVLRFPLGNGRQGEQTVYGFRGRRTIVFLKAGTLLPDGDQAFAREGVDQGQTTIVSTPLQSALDPSGDCIRLADILLDALVWNRNPLQAEQLPSLAEPGADPWVRLYAAYVWLREGTAAAESPALANEGKGQANWAALAATLVSRLEQDLPGTPDLNCLKQQLAHLGHGMAEAAPLQAPPSVLWGWKWITAHSVIDPGLVTTGWALVGPSTTRVGGGPWLVWEAQPAEAQTADVPQAAIVQEAIGDVVDLISRIHHDSAGNTALTEQFEELLVNLTPTAQRIANTAFVTAGSILSAGRQLVETVTENPRSPEFGQIFANAAGLPATQLLQDLRATLRELGDGSYGSEPEVQTSHSG